MSTATRESNLLLDKNPTVHVEKSRLCPFLVQGGSQNVIMG
uniref:Uncharacterized protein n=1 Tax=Arundo donax TaxID=35708 RepID=A0A0A8ZFH4_ARUDO